MLDLGEPIPEAMVVPPPSSTDMPVDTAPPPTDMRDEDTETPPDDDSDEGPNPDDRDADVVPPENEGGSETSSDEVEGGSTEPTDTTLTCGPGFTACDAGCVLGDGCIAEPSCAETCSYDHARTECVEEVCTFVGCDAGWVDCDGEPTNGCEVDFGSATPRDPVQFLERTISAEEDWTGLPVYPLEQPCDDCGQDFSGEPAQVAIYRDVAPAPANDLRAAVSFAWSNGGLSLRAVVVDDQLVVGRGRTADATEIDARFNDNLVFVFDGDTYGTSGDAQDHHLYLGMDGIAFDQRIPEADRLRDLVAIDVETRGSCQVMDARISRAYLSGGNSLDLETGQTYGFALAINDFDDSEATPPEPQRQHQEFLLSPGEDYVYGPRMLPRLELVSAESVSDAGSP